ncbi:MAG: hypothetical protein WC444_06135 [Candidatus Paceibacterota bacterium]
MLTNIDLQIKTGLTTSDFIIKGATDFKYWAETLYDYTIKPYHIEWANNLTQQTRSSTIAARGLGKSLILGTLMPIWLSFYDYTPQTTNLKGIVIAAQNLSQSTKLMMNIRNHINKTELTQLLIPKTGDYTWTKKEINTTTDWKINVLPYSDNARGPHVPYLLMEEAGLFTDLEIYTDVFLPMIQRANGNAMLLGTPKTAYDLLARSQIPGSGYQISKYPLIKNGECILPEIFPPERIQQIRKDIGELSFAREYLLEIVGEGRAIKTQHIIDSLDPTETFTTLGTETGEYYIGADLALSPTGDYTVLTVIERYNGRYHIRKIEEYRGMSFDNQINTIATLYKQYNPVTLLIDESNFGGIVTQKLQTQYNIPAQSIKFLPTTRNTMLIRLINTFTSNKITIPRNPNCPTTLTLTDHLLDQISSLHSDKTRSGQDTYKASTKHDDSLMSLALALHAAGDTDNYQETAILTAKPPTNQTQQNKIIQDNYYETIQKMRQKPIKETKEYGSAFNKWLPHN